MVQILTNIVVSLMTSFTSWLVTMGLQKIHGKQEKAQTDKDIDQKLSKFKEAYKEAFNGQPVTPEQKQKLNSAISDFLRGDGHGL